ncbi:MAG: hypothetical protein HYV03_02080 [Deltaproteobacteria bacterium]|nr:hypothetical protein [Deltaproteobacteria bacterium]
MSEWYVIQTKPKKEGDICQQLARARYDIFFPQMRGGDRMKPLFPSYVFVHTDCREPAIYQLIRYTRGVRRVLGDTDGPRPISAAIVHALRQATLDGSLVEQSLLLRVGDTVRIRRGLLRDLVGIIERNVPDAGRVRVLFKWLRSNMRAEVAYGDLERLAA